MLKTFSPELIENLLLIMNTKHILISLCTALFAILTLGLSAQPVTYIGEAGGPSFAGNQGGGTPLFNQHVSLGGDMFIDWEAYNADGGTQTTICRAVVRGNTAASDGTSVIASDIVCIADGNFVGKQGNNDDYFVNLNTCNLAAGRYSVEIQCDEFGGDYDNSTGGATAITTWDYLPPESPTYYYGDAAGNCNLSDGLDNIQQETAVNGGQPGQLEYFSIGDADVYRTMLVINGLFMDMTKFQPGNPTLPSSFNDLQTLYNSGCVGVGSFPTAGFCDSDMLEIGGAEVNVFKYDCGDGFGTGTDANVTANRLFYRIYESGTTAPAFSGPVDINVAVDDCPGPGPDGVTFPTGGSCQNQQGILDQRWQTANAGIDLLALAPTAGDYVLEVYTETDITDCTGTASTITDGPYLTGFTRLDSTSADCGCGANNGTLSTN